VKIRLRRSSPMSSLRALARDPALAARLLGPGIEIVVGDLADPRSLPLALDHDSP
jgi:uncharacterized protein YbjT (DUF2867 family)